MIPRKAPAQSPYGPSGNAEVGMTWAGQSHSLSLQNCQSGKASLPCRVYESTDRKFLDRVAHGIARCMVHVDELDFVELTSLLQLALSRSCAVALPASDHPRTTSKEVTRRCAARR